jgi:hypothetical protein
MVHVCFAAFTATPVRTNAVPGGFLTELIFIRPLVWRGIEPRSIYDARLTGEEIAHRQEPREAAGR